MIFATTQWQLIAEAIYNFYLFHQEICSEQDKRLKGKRSPLVSGKKTSFEISSIFVYGDSTILEKSLPALVT